MSFLDSVQARAAASPRKIVFAEGTDARTQAAVADLARRRIVEPIIVLDPAHPESHESLRALGVECSIDDFAKVDLRVARVLSAEAIKEANKLLKLTVSLGGGTTRTIFAGIKAAYTPEALVGRLVVVVANLAPRKMKFGTSEGMVIAAGPGASEVYVLAPDSGAKPGQRVH